jgi:hypothetical protein
MDGVVLVVVVVVSVGWKKKSFGTKPRHTRSERVKKNNNHKNKTTVEGLRRRKDIEKSVECIGSRRFWPHS